VTIHIQLGSLPNDLDQHPFPPSAVELAVEDPFPCAKVQSPVGHRYDYLSAHDLPLEVSVGVVLPGAVVFILADRCMRGQLFQPFLVILVQTILVVVYQKNTVARDWRGYP
jgi:hypothetical protein